MKHQLQHFFIIILMFLSYRVSYILFYLKSAACDIFILKTLKIVYFRETTIYTQNI